MDHGRRLFRSPRVRPYISRQFIEHVAETTISTDDDDARNAKENRDVIPRNNIVSKSSIKEESSFTKAKEEESHDQVKNRILRVVTMSSIGKDICIFGSEIVDSYEHVDVGYRYKSRMVVKNYDDKQAANIATKTLAIQCFTQRLVHSLAASMYETSPHIREITQTCIESASPLER